MNYSEKEKALRIKKANAERKANAQYAKDTAKYSLRKHKIEDSYYAALKKLENSRLKKKRK